jgi:hypothetical protein
MNDSIIYNKNVIEFVTVAKEYTGLLEKCNSMNKDNFLKSTLNLLPLIYLKASLLPVFEEPESDESQKFVSETQYLFIQDAISTLLGEDDEYTGIQDASVDRSMDFINLSISELFSDIYQDLGDLIGSFALLDEEIIHSALFVCKDNFKYFWGVRLIVLMQNLHRLSYLTIDDMPDEI